MPETTLNSGEPTYFQRRNKAGASPNHRGARRKADMRWEWMGYLDKGDQLDGDEWKQIFDGEYTAV